MFESGTDALSPRLTRCRRVHGGACENQTNQQVWQNNPVNGQATCYWTHANVVNGEWKTGNNNPPVKIATLITVKPWIRQCFLSGLRGVAGAWNSNGDFARVIRRTHLAAHAGVRDVLGDLSECSDRIGKAL